MAETSLCEDLRSKETKVKTAVAQLALLVFSGGAIDSTGAFADSVAIGGSTGDVLTVTGSGVASFVAPGSKAAPVIFSSGNGETTTSLTPVMAGLGATCKNGFHFCRVSGSDFQKRMTYPEPRHT